MLSRFPPLFALGLTVCLLLSASVAAQSAPDPVGLWTGLGRPTFDATKVAVVEHVELSRDVATITLVNGQLALAEPLPSSAGEERVFAASFKGNGRLRFAPTLPMEKQQLAFHSHEQVLETEFSEAVFLFTDHTLEDLRAQVTFRPGDASDLQKLCQKRNDHWTEYGLNWEPRLLKALLADDPNPHALFVAELKTRQHGWLTLIVDAADPEEVELQRFDSSRHAMSVWSKFPAGGRRPQEVFAEPLRNQEYRLESYKLNVTAEGNARLEAEVEVHFVMRRGGERALLLALEPNLRVTEVTDADGQPLVFFQPKEPKDRYFPGDYLVVVLPEPLSLGPHRLRFRYGGKRVVRKVGAGNYFCQSFGWYPTYGAGRWSLTSNEFADRYDFDLTLRVPKKYEVVATGEKVEERKEDKYRITRWQSELPLAVAGFAFGDYKIHTEKVGETRVEVYANKQPDDFFRSLEILTSDTMPHMGGSRRDPLILGSLAPSRLAKEMAIEVGNSLRVFTRYFGAYPYKKLAVSNIPYSYGQGWPSLLYISAVSFLDSSQRHQLGIRDHKRITDFFRAHEASHQWWGHAVGWKSYHDQWLSEGFAEFSGILYTLHRRNADEYFRLLRKDREELLQRDREGAVYEQIGPVYAGRRLSSARHPGGYGTVIYNKGGWILHMLRNMLYDPSSRQNPEAAFMAMMKDFTRTYHNQPASTEDFKAIVEKHMTPAMNLDGNGKMDWFFDSWVYGTGIPVYRLHYSIEPSSPPGKFILRGTLHQSNVPEGFRTIVPIYLHQGKNYVRAGWLSARGRETPFQVTLGFKPDKVTINEWEDVLAWVK